MQKYLKLKADRPPTRNYPHMPTDYRHTDNHLRLVMVLIALYWSNGSAVREDADGQTDGRTDGRYQVHYLPRFAVDNNHARVFIITISKHIQ